MDIVDRTGKGLQKSTHWLGSFVEVLKGALTSGSGQPDRAEKRRKKKKGLRNVGKGKKSILLSSVAQEVVNGVSQINNGISSSLLSLLNTGKGIWQTITRQSPNEQRSLAYFLTKYSIENKNNKNTGQGLKVNRGSLATQLPVWSGRSVFPSRGRINGNIGVGQSMGDITSMPPILKKIDDLSIIEQDDIAEYLACYKDQVVSDADCMTLNDAFRRYGIMKYARPNIEGKLEVISYNDDMAISFVTTEIRKLYYNDSGKIADAIKRFALLNIYRIWSEVVSDNGESYISFQGQELINELFRYRGILTDSSLFDQQSLSDYKKVLDTLLSIITKLQKKPH